MGGARVGAIVATVCCVALGLASVATAAGAGAGAATTPFTGPEPIVFVHGWNDDASSFDTMIDRFEADGFPADRLFAFEYDYDASTATVTAPLLEAYVDDVLAATGAPEVDIVAYSMGSLSSRWCIKFGGCATVVDDWVSLGGPNHGTLWSDFCAIITPVGCGDMAQASPVVTALNEGDPTPGDLVSWATYRTTCDAVIVPSESTELDGAVNTVLEGCLSHDDHVLDAGEYALVKARVDERTAPSAPQDLAAAPGDGEVTLTWAPPASDGGSPITGYRVFLGASQVDELDVPPEGSAELTLTLSGLENGEPFTFTVTAANAAGEGPASDPATATPEADEVVQHFSDVPPSHPFFLDVEWVAGEGIAEGFSDGTFRPSASVSRQAMAAFLRRLAGSPVVTPGPSPTFSDVSASHPFFLDVEWVAGEGIAEGYDDGGFHPGAVVSRQAMAAFLHRFADAIDLTP